MFIRRRVNERYGDTVEHRLLLVFSEGRGSTRIYAIFDAGQDNSIKSKMREQRVREPIFQFLHFAPGHRIQEWRRYNFVVNEIKQTRLSLSWVVVKKKSADTVLFMTCEENLKDSHDVAHLCLPRLN